MSFTKVQIIHMVAEAVIIGAVSVYLIIRMNRLNSKVDQLEGELAQERHKTQILEAVLQEVVRFQPDQCKQRINLRVQQLKQNSIGQPPQRQQPQQQQQQQPPQQQQQQPPRSNPLESIMSMMAPMMSSMIVGEPDNEVEIEEEITPPVKDTELAEELSELDTKKGEEKGEEKGESDKAGIINKNTAEEKEKETGDQGDLEKTRASENDDDLLEQHEDETPEGIINA